MISLGAEKLPPFVGTMVRSRCQAVAVRSVAGTRPRYGVRRGLMIAFQANRFRSSAQLPPARGQRQLPGGPSKSAVIASGAGPMPCVGSPCSEEDIVLTAQHPGRSFHAEGPRRHAVVAIVATSGKPKEEAAGYGWASRARQCRQSSQPGGMRALRLPSLSGRQLPITASWNQPSLRFAWSQTMICKAPLLSWTTSLRSWK